MKIIFLDIDGVLNNSKDIWKDHFFSDEGVLSRKAIELLNDLTDKTGAKIVISSVWRSAGLEKLQKVFKDEGITGEVIDITGRGCHNCYRGNEIYRWIKDNEEVIGEKYYKFKEYVILDDDSDMLYWQRNNFVCVDNNVGITEKIVFKAKEILGKKVNPRKMIDSVMELVKSEDVLAIPVSDMFDDKIEVCNTNNKLIMSARNSDNGSIETDLPDSKNGWELYKFVDNVAWIVEKDE